MRERSRTPTRRALRPTGGWTLAAWLVITSTTCAPAPSRLEMAAPEVGPAADRGLPRLRPGDRLVRHLAIALVYDEPREVAAWVAHTITRASLAGNAERSDDFREDPSILTGSAKLIDYRGSGYDRGHLAPAADFRWSARAMSESFLLSNIAPQSPSFNRGIWRRLETLVRSWVDRDGVLYVVTGPVYDRAGSVPTIGPSDVDVPPAFFKVVLDDFEPEVKAIGFIIPHAGFRGSPLQFAVPVDVVEQRTGLDFFPALPDAEEAAVEARVDIDLWSR